MAIVQRHRDFVQGVFLADDEGLGSYSAVPFVPPGQDPDPTGIVEKNAIE
jgi:hypothetical protein